MLTFGDAKQLIAKYAGSGGYCSDADVNLFVRKTLQFLLINSASQDLRRFEGLVREASAKVLRHRAAIYRVCRDRNWHIAAWLKLQDDHWLQGLGGIHRRRHSRRR